MIVVGVERVRSLERGHTVLGGLGPDRLGGISLPQNTPTHSSFSRTTAISFSMIR